MQPPNPRQSLLPAPQAGAPQTRAEFDALVAKRSELSNQLQSVSERRRELAEQLRQSTITTRGDLQARLKAFDDRSARLESEILKADDGIADAIARGIGTQRREATTIRQLDGELRQLLGGQVPSRRDNTPQIVATSMFAEGVAFVLLGVLLWRFGWKRMLAKIGRPLGDQSKLDQIQQAVDVIAVEVERISENQRYVTKVLNEKLQPAVGAGEAQHIRAKHKSAVPVRSSDDA